MKKVKLLIINVFYIEYLNEVYVFEIYSFSFEKDIYFF
jgi:hypothetical protein